MLASAARRLEEAGIDSARLDARVLMAHVLGVKSDAVISISTVTSEQATAFESLVARRAAREPLAYIIGIKEFFSLEFEVGPGALVPRPETEALVEEAMRSFPDRDAALDVLDLGTGSACLLVAFLARYQFARGVGVDESEAALAWAGRNVRRHGLSGRCALRRCGWNAKGVFDVVFANPPYLSEEEFARTAPEIRLFEPKKALAAGCDGLAAYRTIASELGRQLRPGGLGFLEIGVGQDIAVKRILEENGLELRRLTPDLAGVPRCVIAGRRG